jgi:hypothetical protein
MKYDIPTTKLNNLIGIQKQHTPERTKSFNLTSIQFNKEESELLNKGLEYNLSYNNSTQWLQRLILKTKVVISKLPVNQHEGFR